MKKERDISIKKKMSIKEQPLRRKLMRGNHALAWDGNILCKYVSSSSSYIFIVAIIIFMSLFFFFFNNSYIKTPLYLSLSAVLAVVGRVARRLARSLADGSASASSATCPPSFMINLCFTYKCKIVK